MVEYITAKHPNYLKPPSKPTEHEVEPIEEPKVEADEDLIIGMLNKKQKQNLTTLSSTDKWEHDLLYSLNKRLQTVDMVNILKVFNKLSGGSGQGSSSNLN